MRATPNLLLILIILLSLVVGSSTLTRGHEWGDDFASYIMQAQSILDGRTDEFVERNAFTILNSSILIGPAAYPWGYPVILTPALLLKGVHALTLKLPGLFFFAGFLICLYLLAKNRLTQTESLLLVSLFAFNPTLIKFLDQILSDIPFLFFIFFALLLMTEFKARRGVWINIFLGAVLFFTFFIRTTGLILLASFLSHRAICFYRKWDERKIILVNSVLTTTSFGLLWFIAALIFPTEQGTYFEQLKGLTPVIFQENVSYYFSLFGIFFGTGSAWLYTYYALIVFFLIGAWKHSNADQPLIIFFVLYLIAMLFWPERQGIRFIFPLLPIFTYFAFQGITTVIHKLPARYHLFSQGTAYIFWLVIIGIFLFNSGTRAYANLQDNRSINGPFDPYSSDVYNYIRAETPPDSVIVFFKPRAMRLFTDRDTLMSVDCEHLTLGDYAVISKKAENSQVPPTEIDKCGLALKNLFENQRFIIYELPK
jgi:4-amino-4-deoxy-L-arabinose transferase-like glycosyltransferase